MKSSLKSCSISLFFFFYRRRIFGGKVFKNEPSKICERQPLKILKGYGLLKLQIF